MNKQDISIVVFLVIRNALKKAGPDSVTVPLDTLKDQQDPQAALTEGEAKEPEAPAKQD